jgi:hypothetical protein
LIELQKVVGVAPGLLPRLNDALGLGYFAQCLFRGIGVVPEALAGGSSLELGDQLLLAVEVKDTSAGFRSSSAIPLLVLFPRLRPFEIVPLLNIRVACPFAGAFIKYVPPGKRLIIHFVKC